MKKIRREKIIAISSFLLLTISIYLIRQVSLPDGPWHGIYSTFSWAWITLGFAGILLLLVPNLRWIRVCGAVILVATITLITLQWGVPFGIRDPWIHLGYIQVDYLRETSYPSFHAISEVTATITGISIVSVVGGSALFAHGAGVILLAALATRLSNGSLSIGSLSSIVFLPVVIVSLSGRPIAMVAVIVLTTILVALLPLQIHGKTAILFILSIALMSWHPLAFLLFILVTLAGVILHQLNSHLRIVDNIFGSVTKNIEYWFRPQFLIGIGVIFSFYMFYTETVGERFVASAIVELLSSDEGGTSQSSATGPLIFDVVNHLQDTVAIAAIAILTGIFALIGVILSRRDSIERFLATTAILGTILFMGMFVTIDIISSIGFPASRAIPLAPIILVPGAVIGFCHLHRRTKMTILIAAFVFMIGLAVIFPSPLTGTVQYSSTPSDVERTQWLVNHHGETPIIDAENTYEIADGLYGPETGDELANGNRWGYQSTRRSEPLPWRAAHSESEALIVNHKTMRIKAERRYDAVDEMNQFELESDKIYSGGNSDVYRESEDE